MSGARPANRRVCLLKGEIQAADIPAAGLLVFTNSGTTDAPLMAQAMDPEKLRLAGEPFPVLESVDQRPWNPGPT